MAAIIQEGVNEGYTLHEGPRGEDGRRFAEGVCPAGHPVRMRAQNFGGSRSRCRGCASHGFHADRAAIFYVLVAPVEDISGKSKMPGRPGDVVVKFGICNVGSGRFDNHSRTGFTATPVLALQTDDGFLVAALERSMIRLLADLNMATCHDLRIVFDGCTEAFLSTSDEVETFVEQALKEAHRLGGNFVHVEVSKDRVRAS